ncbi:MAG: GNAT family N-acetyltransferase [Anaerolineae bacterium]|nr:GNAT family N-acetyltransferase [Anaerolineae bacterium]
MSEADYRVRPLEREDREWVAHFLDDRWGSTQIVSRGRALYGHLLAGFVAERILPPDEEEANADDDATEENPAVHMEKIGLLTYHVEEDVCEIVTLDSLDEGKGIGTALLDELKNAAKESKIKRLWCITTNDNLDALRFWQKRSFALVTVHRNAIKEARRLKPQIPITGKNGIPIRDEIELEFTV